ncbi:MAG: AraC family transcriptional regulator [Parahaliea sp.]
MNTSSYSGEVVRASVLFGFERYFRTRGQEPSHLMKLAGLSDTYLHEPDMYLPYQAYIKLLDICAKETGNPLLGAEFGLEQGHQVFGPTAYLISSSNNLQQALNSMLRYYRLHTTGGRLELSHIGRKVMFHFEITTATAHDVTQVLDNACAVGMRMMKSFYGNSWKPDELHLQHDASPELIQHYSRLFGLVPRFNSSWNGYVFSASVLDLPLPKADQTLHRLLERQLDAMKTDDVQDLLQRLAVAVRKAMAAGNISLRDVAQMMAMSPRSLQRHLSSRGATFQSVLTDVRQQLAKHYLRHSNYQLSEIADLLCFNGLSHFSHAFKRWYGVSPGQWKKLHSH